MTDYNDVSLRGFLRYELDSLSNKLLTHNRAAFIPWASVVQTDHD